MDELKYLSLSCLDEFKETDCEFVEMFDNFAFNEVTAQTKLEIDKKTRLIAILATLTGCQAIDIYKQILPVALKYNVTAIEIKEIIYQAVAYLGFARVYPFLKITNEILKINGKILPLEKQSNTSSKTRLEKGIQAQVDIFGKGMKDFYKSGAKETVHINKWLAENCFGDYYTRGGLDYKLRELITFCYISAQGGCEPQLTAHATANLKIGNSKDFMIAVISSLIPFIGYPRSLNALTCLNNAAKSFIKEGE